jgi:hypothetical protein
MREFAPFRSFLEEELLSPVSLVVKKDPDLDKEPLSAHHAS